ncbi:polysaccharide lyase 6 family protein [Paenibacillus sp. J5C_2022]|uniref:polysaccharide lyase 6 family protein n=1 Tax=Paenibacillus sp. J5C2022 TaxID=2977129 RepID=UPI0021CF837B|nr:polysaccharide lyase 6 family protein [Paenibacillus sp. J5C2022]MCU6712283.1 polysaccharide lyase 6 family protein [Paenibacillus sp. J5C2022]
MTSMFRVSNSDELAAAIRQAGPGSTILLEDGIYHRNDSYIIEDMQGSDTSVFSIQAVNKGKAVLSGESSIRIVRSSHVRLWGLRFQNERGIAVILDGSRHVHVERNTFEPKPSGSNYSLLSVVGSGSGWNRIAHNSFGPKSDPGPLVIFDGDGRSISQHDVIEFNYFHNVGPRIENGLEVIRLGLSGISLSNGYITIQHNLFENCDGEPEIISVKSGHNTIRYNTFLHSAGQVTSRHGHGNRFYGNRFIGDGVKEEMGGFRIYGNDHQLFDNYMENLTAEPLLIDGGNYDGGADGYPADPTVEELRKHWRVYRASVINNTIVNCRHGITMGKRVPYAPEQCIVAHNRMYSHTAMPMIHEYHPTSAANIHNVEESDVTVVQRPEILTRADVGPDSN